MFSADSTRAASGPGRAGAPDPSGRKGGRLSLLWGYVKRIRWAVRLAVLLLIVGIFVVGFDGLFYHPSDENYGTPRDVGLEYEDVTFETADGLKLSGWYLPAKGDARGTVIHFHGNAANISNHVFASYWLVYKGFNLFVFDYRGYGKSEGRVTRAGTIRDGHAALDYILSRADTDPERVFAFGQSLGGAVATVVAAERNEFRAVVLDSTFSSYRGIASRHLRKTFRFRWLADAIAWAALSDDYNPIDYVARISPRPLMVIASAEDRICFAELGRELFDAADEPKTWILLERGRHLESVSDNVDGVQQRIVEFLNDSPKAEQ